MMTRLDEWSAVLLACAVAGAAAPACESTNSSRGDGEACSASAVGLSNGTYVTVSTASPGNSRSSSKVGAA